MVGEVEPGHSLADVMKDPPEPPVLVAHDTQLHVPHDRFAPEPEFCFDRRQVRLEHVADHSLWVGICRM